MVISAICQICARLPVSHFLGKNAVETGSFFAVVVEKTERNCLKFQLLRINIPNVGFNVQSRRDDF